MIELERDAMKGPGNPSGLLLGLRRSCVVVGVLALVATAGHLAVTAAWGVDGGLHLTVSWRDPEREEIQDALVKGIDFAFLDGLPEEAQSRYRARWTGFIYVAEGGDYELQLRADDRASVLIGPGPRLRHGLGSDRWIGVETLTLEPGLHPITAEHVQGIGGALLDLRWGRAGESAGRIDVGDFYPPATDVEAAKRAVGLRRWWRGVVGVWALAGLLALVALALGAMGDGVVAAVGLGCLAMGAYVALLARWFNDPGVLGEGSMRAYSVAPFVAFFLAAIAAIAVAQRTKWRAMGTELAAAWRLTRAEMVALTALVVLSLLFQLPTVLYPAGLVHSDVAINGLMGLHIAEGRVAPAFYYGQMFLGTFFSHVLALLFVFTGPFVGGLPLMTSVFYAGFLVAVYFLVRQASVASVAWATAFWLAIPQGTLVTTLGQSEYPQLLLFSSWACALTAARAGGALRKDAWWGVVGFVFGMAFWAHPLVVTAVAAVAVSLPFVLTVRELGAAAWRLVLGFFVGITPALVGWGMFTGRFVEWFLDSGGRDGDLTFFAAGELVFRRALSNVVLGRGRTGLPEWTGAMIAAALALAIGWVVVRSVVYGRRAGADEGGVAAERSRVAASLPLALFVAFQIALLASQRRADLPIRFIIPAFLGLPAVVAIALWGFAEKRTRYAARLATALMLLWAAFPLSGSIDRLRDLPAEQASMDASLEAMGAAGVETCLANYWDAYRISYLTLEEIVCDPVTHRRIERYQEIIKRDNDGGAAPFVAAPQRIEWLRRYEEGLRDRDGPVVVVETPSFFFLVPSDSR